MMLRSWTQTASPVGFPTPTGRNRYHDSIRPGNLLGATWTSGTRSTVRHLRASPRHTSVRANCGWAAISRAGYFAESGGRYYVGEDEERRPAALVRPAGPAGQSELTGRRGA